MPAANFVTWFTVSRGHAPHFVREKSGSLAAVRKEADGARSESVIDPRKEADLILEQ